MNNISTLDELLDAIEHLPEDQQLQLADVVRRRVAAREHQRIVEDVKQARKEYEEGKARVMTVDDLMREIES